MRCNYGGIGGQRVTLIINFRGLGDHLDQPPQFTGDRMEAYLGFKHIS